MIGRAALVTMLILAPAAHAYECTPIATDNVSLGEKAARFYAERSMKAAIDSEKDRIVRMGKAVGRVAKPVFACAYYSNILAADEWRCTGESKVCTKD